MGRTSASILNGSRSRVLFNPPRLAKRVAGEAESQLSEGDYPMKTVTTLLIYAACALASQSDRAGLKPGTLAEPWQTGGPNGLPVPDWQVHEYNEDFYIPRESGCVHFEKPFLYLIFGGKALPTEAH